MKRMENNSIDSIVTDPPAGIHFMKEWDSDKGGRDQWIAWMTEVASECLRVTKPGGHALVWSLPRTSHWTATAWEDAGWEVRDKIIHIYGQGFPKSMDISKAIDKKAGVEREIIGIKPGHEEFAGRLTKGHIDFKNGTDGFDRPWMHNDKSRKRYHQLTAPTSDAAKQWSGYGTALKPAHEDWILLRKPIEGTVAQNVLEYGVGGINIDGCRVEMQLDDAEKSKNNWKPKGYDLKSSIYEYGSKNIATVQNQQGRFPSNLIHDGSDEVLALFPQSRGMSGGGAKDTNKNPDWVVQPFNRQLVRDEWIRCDSGSAARFFYCAKPSPSERGKNNKHPTVKSIALMRYLCRMITPPGGVVLDPFGGSGSTAIAAREEGFNYILIEKEKESVDTAIERLKEWMEKSKCPN